MMFEVKGMLIKKLFNEDAGNGANSGTNGKSEENKVDGANDNKTSSIDQKQDAKSMPIFTQEQLNVLMGERLDRQKKSFYEKLGVKNEEELNNLVASAKSYNDTKDELTSLRKEKLFNENNINIEKTNDIEFYFKGKGIVLNDTNLKEELKTHNEWLKPSPQLGAEQNKNNANEDSEEKVASKLWGLNFKKK